jgi:acetyl esterase/lipase
MYGCGDTAETEGATDDVTTAVGIDASVEDTSGEDDPADTAEEGGPGGASDPTEPADIAAPTDGAQSVARVHEGATFEVSIIPDVAYAQGLTHSNWSSDDASVMDLLLDLYVPDNDEAARPAVIFIHGGGFRSGDKSDDIATLIPSYFAERGFVGVSINYRLEMHRGTLPAAIQAAADAAPTLDDDRRNQVKAMSVAGRDAKAALRWLVAHVDG